MIFNLKIMQDDYENGSDQLVAEHLHVDVQWDSFATKNDAIATKDGVEIARLHTYDDYPINIHQDSIIITGFHPGAPDRKEDIYGEWVLTPAV